MSSVAYAGMNALSASLNGALRGSSLLNSATEKAIRDPVSATASNGATSAQDSVNISDQARGEKAEDPFQSAEVQNYSNLSNTRVVDTDYEQFNRVLNFMFPVSNR